MKVTIEDQPGSNDRIVPAKELKDGIYLSRPLLSQDGFLGYQGIRVIANGNVACIGSKFCGEHMPSILKQSDCNLANPLRIEIDEIIGRESK